MKKFLFVLLVNLFVSSSLISQKISGTYAIQSIATTKNLRPYDAGNHNGNKIVLYNHVEWKCMTWQFIYISDNTYQLKNLFTSKTFQAKELLDKKSAAIDQQPLSDSRLQLWEFIKKAENNYMIRLKGTELYISALSTQTNSEIVLLPESKNALQSWKLIAQNPDM